MRNSGDLRDRLRLYVVTDERPDIEDLLRVVRAALAGGATAVQLRRKHDDGGQLVELGRAIRKLTHEFDALYFVNDRVDVALLTDADGVHLGQSDISCRDARTLVGDKIIGISARTVDEAVAAARDGADYLGVGAVFPTTSKSDAELCHLDGLRAIASRTDIPIVAIGGITVDNVQEVIRAGADGAAVVSAVMQAPDPAAASRLLLAHMEMARQA
jgi:thiamine-phosphate pyrophosphorylase